GYGKNVNPCLDCRIYMFTIARHKMEEYDAHFIFTGEVLGQRPKSQHLDQLRIINHQSGLEDRILRPLSALLLPPTLPEREGWVDRSQLMGFHGRTRKPQMALAAELGLANYPQPAGGCCFLTDPAFSRKVRDLWEHSPKDELTWEDYLLLKVGRHLRLGAKTKLIIGRNEGENLYLDQMRGDRWRVEVQGCKGPVGIIDGEVDEEILTLASKIVARYSDGRATGFPLIVHLDSPYQKIVKKVEPLDPEWVAKYLIL
ncbi:MAG: tRNA (5-methylaminomethyl-2-thiouridylate)-methyltransferase, partial [bacterium]